MILIWNKNDVCMIVEAVISVQYSTAQVHILLLTKVIISFVCIQFSIRSVLVNFCKYKIYTPAPSYLSESNNNSISLIRDIVEQINPNNKWKNSFSIIHAIFRFYNDF